MSEQAVEGAPAGTEGQASPEVVELPHGDAAFAGLMDALAPEPEEQPAGEGAAAPGTPGAGGDGGAAAAGDGGAGAPAGDGGAGGADAQPDAAGDAGAAAGSAQQPAAPGGGGDLPAGWDVDAASLTPKLNELGTKFEERVSEGYRRAALESVQTEHAPYFEALNKHPRLLVGTQVPAIGKEGMETLRSSEDAREWQDAVKHLLVAEVNDRAGRELEGNRGFMDTVHASIELFQKNVDLIPGTKGFDRQLADRFTALVKPYELRADGKLQGYSIPVQPIIDQVRSQLVAERAAAKPAAPAAGAPAATTPAAGATSTGDQPQAGIPSKAGSGGNAEDYSTLFGTLGLPDFRI